MIPSAELTRTRWVEARLRSHDFASSGPVRFGAEMELLALDASTRAVAAIEADGRPSTLPAVRAVAEELGWREGARAKGVPRFVSASGGALTFEPGGQLEYASAVHASVDGVLRELRTVYDALVRRCADRGVTLCTLGIDAEHTAEEVPLQIRAERYRRMDAYFARIGPDGARMMRQTASLQLCVGGVDIAARWGAANAIAPWLVAIFANSRRYAGRDTGCASYRAETWRGVDPRRTGIVAGVDPVPAYAAFALAAPAFLAGGEDDAPVAFADLPDAHATDDALVVHLSTLFPEVRPRGYLELRSADAIDVRHHAATMVFVAGLVADDASARAAREVVGEPSATLLRAAGTSGLADERLAARAPDLVELALAGCARLGPSVVSKDVLANAQDSFATLLADGTSGDSARRQASRSSSRPAELPLEVSPRCFVSSNA